MSEPRILFAAPSSGSGKTTVTCGILAALKRRGKAVFSFKCGPDYIDPMFQERVIGVRSGTLDLFFSGEEQLRRLFHANAAGSDIAVIEGVMGYYDGLGAATEEASTYRVAKALRAPVVLIVNARGQALSAVAMVEGFARFRADSGIRGVIFNQMSEGVYAALKPEVERLGLAPLGYVPRSDDVRLESRHLGLITPGEIADLDARLDRLAALLEKTLDIDGLISLAEEAPELPFAPEPAIPPMPRTRIAVARDEAFCFLYKDNLALLRRWGAELVFFSPIHDAALPEDVQGLILPGGYPELYAKELSKNTSMLASVREAIRGGMPCLAECGGFMYLHGTIEDMQGVSHPMVGVWDKRVYPTKRLNRFGYVTLTARGDSAFLRAGESVRGHEFHYYESETCGEDLHARKPYGGKNWDCIHAEGNLLAGFPHLFYESEPRLIERFLRRCAKEE